MANLMGKKGKVIGLEHVPELVEKSIKNIEENYKDILDND